MWYGIIVFTFMSASAPSAATPTSIFDPHRAYYSEEQCMSDTASIARFKLNTIQEELRNAELEVTLSPYVAIRCFNIPDMKKS